MLSSTPMDSGGTIGWVDGNYCGTRNEGTQPFRLVLLPLTINQAPPPSPPELPSQDRQAGDGDEAQGAGLTLELECRATV